MKTPLPDLSLENKYNQYTVVGVDEVGRGAWAGPVVVGAVIIKPENSCKNIIDSKKLSASSRQTISKEILKNHICGIGSASVEEIIKFGINEATFIAVERAISSLPLSATFMLIDGNYRKTFSIPSMDVVKGDSISISIAAASIIAKVYRDNLMEQLSLELPVYNWDSNVGYGTKNHLKALSEHGISSHHRTNYKPIAAIQFEKPCV